jgi:hypothetical protein
MVKRISIFMLAVVSAVILAGCTARGTDENQTQADISGNNQALTTEDIKLTENPAEEPTEVPTEKPTPEPTATPVPHITSPNVPEDVEIVCLQQYVDPFGTSCITKKDDGYYAQRWRNKELKTELAVPDDMVEDIEYLYDFGTVEGGNMIVETKHADGTYSLYLKTKKSSLYLRGYIGVEGAWQEFLVEHNVIIATNPGWDDYYYKETFPEDYDIEWDSNTALWVEKNTGRIIYFHKYDETTEKIKF